MLDYFAVKSVLSSMNKEAPDKSEALCCYDQKNKVLVGVL